MSKTMEVIDGQGRHYTLDPIQIAAMHERAGIAARKAVAQRVALDRDYVLRNTPDDWIQKMMIVGAVLKRAGTPAEINAWLTVSDDLRSTIVAYDTAVEQKCVELATGEQKYMELQAINAELTKKALPDAMPKEEK